MNRAKHILVIVAALLAGLAIASPAQAATVTYGQDVSSYQGNVNWAAQWSETQPEISSLCICAARG